MVWIPRYTVPVNRNGTRSDEIAEVREIECDECPRSLLLRNPEAREIVNAILSAESIKQASGSHPFGPSRHWDAHFADAVLVVQRERNSARYEQQKVINRS